MSFNGITVIGMVSGTHIIEDIRVTVPFRVAVQISAEQANWSRDLKKDLQEKRIVQIQGALPAGAVFRGHGAVPRAAAPINGKRRQTFTEVNTVELQGYKDEIVQLKQELEASKEKAAQLQSLNLGLQTTLTTMSTQLQSIQTLLQELKKQGIQVTAVPGTPGVSVSVDEDVPLFIPESFKKEGAKINISVEEKAQETNLSSSRDALKKLRQNKSK